MSEHQPKKEDPHLQRIINELEHGEQRPRYSDPRQPQEDLRRNRDRGAMGTRDTSVGASIWRHIIPGTSLYRFHPAAVVLAGVLALGGIVGGVNNIFQGSQSPEGQLARQTAMALAFNPDAAVTSTPELTDEQILAPVADQEIMTEADIRSDSIFTEESRLPTEAQFFEAAKLLAGEGKSDEQRDAFIYKNSPWLQAIYDQASYYSPNPTNPNSRINPVLIAAFIAKAREATDPTVLEQCDAAQNYTCFAIPKTTDLNTYVRGGWEVDLFQTLSQGSTFSRAKILGRVAETIAGQFIPESPLSQDPLKIVGEAYPTAVEMRQAIAGMFVNP